ncbi:hypothetical protein IKG45_01405 [Candidatus Saccharibacteria bacterium]|nr:hypothetical protein [Candidatus Saccharibacteria bacterium]
MSASPETKIIFELSGSGASPADMEPATPSQQAPTSSDTGLFTASDSLSAGSVIVGLSICLLIAVGIIALKSIKQPKMRTSGVSKNFNLGKGIFKKFGIFVLFILASGAILPNLLPESESASALIPEGATTIELTTGSGGKLTAGTTIAGKTGKLAHEKEALTCKSECDIYISTATSGNSLYYNNDTTKGWIGAKSGAKSALAINTWGYATSVSGVPSATASIWSVIPAKGNEVKVVSNLEANKEFEITYGAYVNGDIPTGSYSNTIVYTAVKPV